MWNIRETSREVNVTDRLMVCVDVSKHCLNGYASHPNDASGHEKEVEFSSRGPGHAVDPFVYLHFIT